MKFLGKKMPDLEATIFNQKLKLSYQENEKERLIKAIDTLNKSWNKYSNLNGKVSDLKIITLMSLELQDSIDDYKSKSDMNKNNLSVLKKELDQKSIELKEKKEKIYKLELEMENINNETSKIESVLNELHNELLNLKTKILDYKNE